MPIPIAQVNQISQVEIKRSGTYDPQWTFKNDNGTLMDISGFEFQSTVRDSKRNVVAFLDCSDVNLTTSTVIPVPVDTSDWPIGIMRTDIKMVVNGKVRHSGTQLITITSEET